LKDRAKLSSLAPLQLPDRAFTNLPDNDLSPVGVRQLSGKPFDKPPRYWKWEKFSGWLTDPQGCNSAAIADWGHDGPPKDTRTHVGIEPGEIGKPSSLTAIDGALYQTRGLEFTYQSAAPKVGGKRLALAIWTSADKLVESMIPFGGERRLTHWRKSDTAAENEFADCKKAVIEKIKRSKGGDSYFCRLVLLTPANFTQGYRPDWLLKMQTGVKAELKGIAINRAQVVSGWDFDRTKSPHGQPKATRRLAPAGAVYFLKLTSNEQQIETWLNQAWLQCVSDEPQDRLDG
jgi:CRISPR-associated protein Cmr3